MSSMNVVSMQFACRAAWASKYLVLFMFDLSCFLFVFHSFVIILGYWHGLYLGGWVAFLHVCVAILYHMYVCCIVYRG